MSVWELYADRGAVHKQNCNLQESKEREAVSLLSFSFPRGEHRDSGLLASVYLAGKAVLCIMVITNFAKTHCNQASF